MDKTLFDEGEAPRIWTRRPKIVETKDPIVASCGIAGEFRLRVYRPDGRCRRDTGFFPNLITNLGLNGPGNGQSSYKQAFSVGTGNTAPTFTDTSLVARVASTSAMEAEQYAAVGDTSDPDRYYSYTRTHRFGAGAAAGNLAEVGVTEGNTPWNCYSRALILDGGGSPTTITVLSDEYLDVTYRQRWYAGNILTDFATTLSITGSATHDIVIRRSSVGDTSWRPSWTWNAGQKGVGTGRAYNGALGAITTVPSGSSSGHTSASNAAYTPDSYQQDYTVIWGLNDGNLAGGISVLRIEAGTGHIPPGSGGSAASAYQFSLDPVINKIDTQILTLNFRQSWARRSI